MNWIWLYSSPEKHCDFFERLINTFSTHKLQHNNSCPLWLNITREAIYSCGRRTEKNCRWPLFHLYFKNWEICSICLKAIFDSEIFAMGSFPFGCKLFINLHNSWERNTETKWESGHQSRRQYLHMKQCCKMLSI